MVNFNGEKLVYVDIVLKPGKEFVISTSKN